jgi:formamidopyrimidine-DNA glycosylase
MPELPEVETVKNELAPHVVGKRIIGITPVWAGIIKEIPVEEFAKRISGRKITALSRHGKYLLFHLSNGDKLVVHLKMTGSLILGTSEPPKYTRAIIHLDDEHNIYFRDPRKFGVLKLIKNVSEVSNKLGPEPFDRDFTVKKFAERLKNRTAPIKALLLDQKFLAGVGNMYADEALFAARIYPARISGSLTIEEIARLHRTIRQVLKAGIRNKGASIVTYYHPDGSKGTAHFQFKVAHGMRENCAVCDTPIKRVVVRGRGTYYCPKCQPEKISNIK